MGFPFSDEKIAQMKADWALEHPTPPTHAERLCELARANPDAKVRDLAYASERSCSWVRRVLKQNGIVLIKPPKKRRLKIKSNTLCTCGHERGGFQRINAGFPSHCTGNVRHGHWLNAQSYICTTRHCLAFNVVDGERVACGCPDFVPQSETEEVKP